MNNILFFFIFIIFISFSTSDVADKYVFVFTHFRHGARAVSGIDNESLDLLKEKWTDPGELTGIGQRMHYLLGLRNRKRYITDQKFLSEKFDAHELLIYSSNYNRTLVSVNCQLQGLYPQNYELGEVLTEEQEKISYPQVKVDYDEIKEEIEKLNRSSLPHRMTVSPIRMINDFEKKILITEIDGCSKKAYNIIDKNLEDIPALTEVVDIFNNKYGEKMNTFLGTKDKKYDIYYIWKICEAFLSDTTGDKDLTEFKKAGIDFKELEDYCLDFGAKDNLYYMFGDSEKKIVRLESSKRMREFIHYMKNRIDADIKGEKIEEQYKDYSRPKMLMISGHETTISSDQVFLMNAFGFNSSFYGFPKYASQMALEVTTKDDGKKKNDYSDYFVNYYLDDNHKFNITAKEFIEKVEPQLWTDDEIDKFCESDTDGNVKENKNKNDNDLDETFYLTNNTTIPKVKDKAKTAYKVLMIIFICLSVILLAVAIVMGCKLIKKMRAPYPQINHMTNYSGKVMNTIDNYN